MGSYTKTCEIESPVLKNKNNKSLAELLYRLRSFKMTFEVQVCYIVIQVEYMFLYKLKMLYTWIKIYILSLKINYDLT